MARKKKRSTSKRRIKPRASSRQAHRKPKSSLIKINPWKAFGLKDTWIWTFLLAIILLTIGLYWPGIHHEFTNWDDPVYVTENRFIREISLANLQHIFTEPLAGNYHPVTLFSLMLNYQLGDSFASFYIVNLVLHLFNGFLVFYFIYILSEKKRWVSLFTALIFAIHPMHIESVAWIAERKDVLYTFFFLLSLISYQFFQKHGSKKYGLLSLLFFALAILSKPAAIVLPAVLVLLDFFESKKITLLSIINKWPYFIIAIVILIITLQTQTSAGATIESDFSTVQRIMISSYIPLAYIFKFFYPVNLSASYPYPPSDALPMIIQLSPLIFIAVASLLFAFRKKQHLLVFCALFFFVNVFLIMQIKMVGEAMLADRYTYVPFIILAFALAVLVDRYLLNRGPVIKYASITLLFLFSAGLYYSSMHRLPVWRNSETLFTDVIEKHPNYYKSYLSRGSYYQDREPEKALADYEKALQLRPHHIGFNNRANIYLNRGNYSAAIADYSRALELKPGFPEAYGNRAGAYFMLKEYDKALQDYNTSLNLNPNIGMFYFNRSRTLNRMGRKQEALKDALQAKRLGFPVKDNYLQGLQN